MSKAKFVVDYTVMTNAIAGAALSRRAALQMEVAVSLVHFTQENGGTDTTGKSNLKAVYHGAGYLCLAKADRDYKTVNRRLNAMAKLFDKIGSSVVHGWIEGLTDTQKLLDKVQQEMVPFGFDVMDDILSYVDVNTSRTSRAPRQPSGPVTTTEAANDEGSAPVAAPVPAAPNLDIMYAMITAGFGPEMIREFCSKLLVHVATVETAAEQDQKAA